MDRSETLLPLRKIFEPQAILVMTDDSQSVVYSSVDHFVCGQLSEIRNDETEVSSTELVAVRSHQGAGSLLLVSQSRKFSEKELLDRILALQPKTVLWSRSNLNSVIDSASLEKSLQKKEVSSCIGI